MTPLTVAVGVVPLLVAVRVLESLGSTPASVATGVGFTASLESLVSKGTTRKISKNRCGELDQ